MTNRTNSLVDIVSQAAYRSSGEKKIAAFLDGAGIKFEYEVAVAIRERGYQRIWYPDFKLPEYNFFIEYLGIEQSPQYDQNSNYKLKTYQANGIDVLALYPKDLRQGYEQKIFNTIQNDLYQKIARVENRLHSYGRNRGSGYRKSRYR